MIAHSYISSSHTHKLEGLVKASSAVLKPRHRQLPETYTVLPEQGRSAIAANKNSVFMAWIEDHGIDLCSTISGKTLIGRLDRDNFDPVSNTIALSGLNGWEGVKVCFCNNKWIAVMHQQNIIKYSVFDDQLNPIAKDITITLEALDASVTGPDHFDVSCVNNLLAIFYSNYLAIINIETNQQNFFTAAYANSSVNRIVAHGNFVDVFYPDINKICYDRYDIELGLVSTGNIFTTGFLGVQQKNIAVTSSPLNVACVFWHSGTIYFQIDGQLPLPITTSPDPDGLFLELAQSEHWSYVIKVGSITNQIIRIQVDNDIVIDQQIINDFSSPGTPIAAPNEFSLWHMYIDAEMLLDVHVTESIYMGLWRIERDTRIFVNPIDIDSKNIIENVYIDHLSGTASGSISDYLIQPGRSGVNVSSDPFLMFFGTEDEDSLFLGGPLGSQIVDSMHNNLNMFDAQIDVLIPATEVISLSFVSTVGDTGFLYDDNAPAIAITNMNGSFVLKRHLNAGQIKDYAFIFRMPQTLGQTQIDKGFVYIAGINEFSSEAASYVYSKSLKFRLGLSLAMLVVVTYPEGTSSYIPGVTGTIETFRMKDINSNNFEG